MVIPEWYLDDCNCDACVSIRWVPPTDEERKMFMDAANAGMNMAFDMWYINECNTIGNARGIAESLAMDGL